MTHNATVTKLPGSAHPWAYALCIHTAESTVFHAFIDSLKRTIPARDRKWEPAAKWWLFKSNAGDVLLALLEAHGLTYDIENEAPAHRLPMSVNEAAATLYLLPSAPPWIVDCVYRAMAKRLHPDAGGDTEQMQKLNLAAEILRGQAKSQL